MKYVLATILAVTLSGCSVFTAKVGPQVAKAVNRYCQEPLSERLLLRGQVNGLITPNAVKVTCANDPE